MSKPNARRWLCAWVCLWLALPLAATDRPTAQIAGKIIDPYGAPFVGFRAVWTDTATGAIYSSGPSARDGRFAVTVPVGGSYRIKHLLSPRGKVLNIAQGASVSIETGGVTGLDILMTRKAPSGLGGGAIAGIVVGSVLAAALVVASLEDDDDEPPASPLMP